MRVVSLVPSVTETLLAWGITPVAVTRFCEHPELPHVGGTKDPDIARIVALAPDLVVVNDEENRKEDFDALTRAGLTVHVVRIAGVDDVPIAMTALADAVAQDYVSPALLQAVPQRVRAFVPIWRRPWMTMNRETYGSSLLARLGVANVFAEADDRYPEISLDEVPPADVVLAPSEPYPFSGRHEAELRAIAPVRLVDGKDLFWWGVRTPGALMRLTAQLSDL
ncbi:MAG TPA: helical backbone metal receptor [Acidimicrobiales bacterium]|nr:helical backbone metal receptor [Acidimicrobiales bacterium]